MTNITRRQNIGLGKTAAGGSGGSFAAHDRASAAPPSEGGDQGILTTQWECDECGEKHTVPATDLHEIGDPVCTDCDSDMQLIGEMPELYVLNRAGGTVDTVAAFVRPGDDVQLGGISGNVTGIINNPNGSITLAVGDHAGVTLDPSARVEVEDPLADIRSDAWEVNTYEILEGDHPDWTGYELGLEDLGVAHAGVSGNPDDGTAYVHATVYENPVTAGSLTQAQFDRGELYLRDALQRDYGIDIHHVEDGNLHMEFSADLRGERAISDTMASDLLSEKTNLRRWRNESDAGTYGSPYFYTDIRKNIDAGFFPGAGDDSTFDHRLQQTAREAASFAVHGRSRDRFPQLAQLSERGYCHDAAAAHQEIVEASADLGEIRETRGLRELLDAEIQAQDQRNA